MNLPCKLGCTFKIKPGCVHQRDVFTPSHSDINYFDGYVVVLLLVASTQSKRATHGPKFLTLTAPAESDDKQPKVTHALVEDMIT